MRLPEIEFPDFWDDFVADEVVGVDTEPLVPEEDIDDSNEEPENPEVLRVSELDRYRHNLRLARGLCIDGPPEFARSCSMCDVVVPRSVYSYEHPKNKRPICYGCRELLHEVIDAIAPDPEPFEFEEEDDE